MNKQITVRITDELAGLLEKRAMRMRRKRSEIIRMALESYLGASPRHGGKTAYERAEELGLIGVIECGPPDLGERHREYLEETGFGKTNNFRE